MSFRPVEFNARQLHGRRGTVVSIISVRSWCYTGLIDKYEVDVGGYMSLIEVWGENLELLALDTMAAITP